MLLFKKWPAVPAVTRRQTCRIQHSDKFLRRSLISRFLQIHDTFSIHVIREVRPPLTASRPRNDRHFAGRVDAFPDRGVDLESRTNAMKQCPDCRNESLVRLEISGVELDSCVCCKGLWFDTTELARTLDRRPLLPQPDSGEGASLGQIPVCPDCKVTLAPVEYGYDSGILVSKCRSCRGAWVRPRQLRQLLEFSRKSRHPTVGERFLLTAMESEKQLDGWSKLIRSWKLSVVAALVIVTIDRSLAINGSPLVQQLALLGLVAVWCSNIDQKPVFLRRFQRFQPSPPISIALFGWILLASALVKMLLRA